MTELETPLASSVSPETPALTQTQRVLFTFTSPLKTFTDIRRNTSWWLPFLLILITGFIFLASTQLKVGWDKVAENQMKLSPKQTERIANMPPDQAAQAKQLGEKFTKYISYIVPVVTLIVAVIFAAVLLATINFGFGGQAKFSQIFAVVFYASLPGIIKSLLATVIIFAGADPDSFLISNPVGTNPGFYLNALETPKWLYSLASSIDIFSIWTYVLMAIGCAAVAKVKRSSGYMAVFGWWIVILLLRLAGTAISG
jgi:Yip1 domain